MPKRKRRRSAEPWQQIMLGIDASRRVGWARYYSEAEHSQQLQALCDTYQDRIEILVPEFLGLIDSVLHDRNLEAFARAYRVQVVIEQYERNHRRTT
jgi:hypothetical protein